MCGIKGVESVLQGLMVIALLSAVKPDGDEREESKALLGEIEFLAEKGEHIRIAAEELKIDIPHERGLTEKVPPFSAAEEIERQHHEDTAVEIIHECEKSQNEAEGDRACRREEGEPPFALGTGFFIQKNKKNTDEESPQHVLVHGVEQCIACYQIEGDLRNDSEDEQTEDVFFEAFRVEISFHNEKSKDGESEPANAGEPFIAVNDRCPKMIAEHEDHCHDAQ